MRDRAELAIVVMELGSNMLKHAGGGSLRVSYVPHEILGPGIELVAADAGPPIRHLELAVQDGFDDRGPIDVDRLPRRGGLGTGLGAVLRLTDRFEHTPLPDGKEIRVIRYRVRPR